MIRDRYAMLFSLGIVVLTMALMGLAFHSARSGHDDRVDDRKRD